MNKQSAIALVKETFNQGFSVGFFKKFIVNIFKNNYQELNRDFVANQYVRQAFRDFIDMYQVIGHFEDNERKKIDVLVVNLKKETSLDSARTMQRNFVSDYLKNYSKGAPNGLGTEAALVVFIAPDEQDWRFSLVKLEHSAQVEDNKIKLTEELTPAKRWSFLVGQNEGSHTVQSRFLNLLQSNDEPNLKELEEAFNIEKVTDEFFKKYCDLFLSMKESLDAMLEKDEILRNDFESKEISTVDFAKKTLGQIAFLYFLQKKGWFGVRADEEWGTGPKNFLRALFERRDKYGKNFFDDVLEPLFYEALAQDRGKESIYPRLNNCRMPFLNGGLFEPMNRYAWETTHIRIPDDLFSNTKKDEKTGDVGDGIFDVFDRYNFTVNENEPLEKEVAVDPEMLGKVFENLLEIKDRKSKGAFYTPREIVHYMCQESLINYLYSETNEEIPRDDIAFFIQKGALIIQNDKIVLEKGRETDTYKFMLPKTIRLKSEVLDNLLSDIKVCDPAVGSGAFPLGMLNEIVRARQVIDVHLGSKKTPYELKLHTISHSIYGVDIDAGATEIAKLRLWLALVVEEKEPHPLPNLEHKIMQGNSLISEYEGIKLFDESLLEEKEKKTIQLGMNFGRTSDVKLEELKNITEDYIHESQRSKKQNLKERIDILKWELIEATLEEQGKLDEKKLENIRKYKKLNTKPFFIWKLEFSDVFKEKGGFDVVIGNPPYTKLDQKNDYDIFNFSAKRLSNSYAYFMEKALSLISDKGDICFIVPNTWLSIDSCEKLREHFIESANLKKIVETFQVFKSMSKTPLVVDTVIYSLSKHGITNDIIWIELDQQKSIDYRLSQISDKKWKLIIKKSSSFLKNNKYKFIQETFKLNISTFLLEDKKNPKFLVRIGCQEYALNGGNPKQSKEMIKKKVYHSSFKVDETYYKFLPCGNIQRYYTKESSSFLKWGDNLHCPREKNIFDQDHLLVSRIFDKNSRKLKSSFVQGSKNDFYINNTDTFNVLVNQSDMFDLKYILAILNSLYIGNYLLESNINLKRAVYPKINTKDLKNIPVAHISQEKQKPIIDLVDQILAITSDPNYESKKPPVQQKELETKIDEMVFDLYGLTDEEREVVLKS